MVSFGALEHELTGRLTMFDDPPDPLKPYRLCQLGFLLLAIGLVPIALLEVLLLAGWLLRIHAIFAWLEGSGLDPIITALTPWATLAGATILWTAWENPGWRRRSGLLMSMCLVDVACWFVQLGDPEQLGEYVWVRSQLGSSLGWAQFALLASLSGDLLVHLGVDKAQESSRSAQALARSGAMIWLIVFWESTNFQGGWPPQRNPRMIHTELLWMGQNIVHMICLLQTTALVVAAFRRLNQEVPRLEQNSTNGLAETAPTMPSSPMDDVEPFTIQPPMHSS